MQAAPLALLRAAGSAGYARQDCARLHPLRSGEGRQPSDHGAKAQPCHRQHHERRGGPAPGCSARPSRRLEKRLDEESVFLLGGLDREIDAIPSGVIKRNARLSRMLQAAAAPRAREAAPIYRSAGSNLRCAMRWTASCGRGRRGLALPIATASGLSTIRASRRSRRRFANDWSDEYDNLRPASDLIGRLQEEISRWLDSPADWTRRPQMKMNAWRRSTRCEAPYSPGCMSSSKSALRAAPGRLADRLYAIGPRLRPSGAQAKSGASTRKRAADQFGDEAARARIPFRGRRDRQERRRKVRRAFRGAEGCLKKIVVVAFLNVFDSRMRAREQ